MFERYTEKARRTIFFARYEASQLGCTWIETEHLLLGLFREDKAMANQFLGPHSKLEAIRQSIEQHGQSGAKIATSVDLPLSHQSKRALAYASEESQRMEHDRIGTWHLLLGLLREESSFAAQLLREQGLTLASVREQVKQSDPALTQGRPAPFARLDEWLAEWEARGGIRIVRQKRAGNRTTHIAIYAGDPPQENETDQDMAAAEKLAQIQKRIDFIVERMEHAIANHEFEKARFYSEEERKERENLRSLREQFHLEELPPRVPILCIEIVSDERLSEVQKRCDDHIARGVAQVWLLNPDVKRAYTATRTEGLREFKGEVLRSENPPLEMDLRAIFD